MVIGSIDGMLYMVARSGRTVCKRCNRKIEKGSVIAVVDGGRWHVSCCGDRVSKVVEDMQNEIEGPLEMEKEAPQRRKGGSVYTV